MLTFANLAGFWALLGIPVILFIHFLQRQSQIVTVSTLFLLEALDRQSIKGRKFDRLRNSIPLWLQLLAVLLLTWLLVEPRWSKANSVQKIALVIDSSASMMAFKDEPLTNAFRAQIPKLKRGAQKIELIAMDSHIDGPSIYNGTSVDDLIEKLAEWEPFRSAHDPGPALRVGRSLVGKNGLVVFVTDHFQENPGYDAKVLAVGDVVENMGFAGVQVDPTTDPPTWRALVKNYGQTVASREWFLRVGQQKTENRSIELQPSETRTLQGRFPATSDRIFLHLSPDEFTLDDSTPIIIPKPKQLAVAKLSMPRVDTIVQGMLSSFENTIPPTDESGIDLVLTTYNPIAPTTPESVSIVMLSQKQPVKQFFKGAIVAANHPLMEALNWQGLIARSSPGMPVAPEDTVLLWQGDRALIFLRQDNERNQLVYNFDIPTSNATQLPAFIVLSHRFVEQIRRQKEAPFSANLELNQTLRLNHSFGEDAADLELVSSDQRTTIPLLQARSLKTPMKPDFFKVMQGENLLLDAAAQFVDTREANFLKAESKDNLSQVSASTVTEHTQQDGAWRLWLIILFGAVLLSWWYINRKRQVSTPSANPDTENDGDAKPAMG